MISMNMYKLLPRRQYSKSQVHEDEDEDEDRYFPISETTPTPTTTTTTSTSNVVSSQFLCEAVFAGESFWGLEAAYGRVDGVIKTVTGYCGGTLTKPTYREVCEGRTGHTEVVKVTYDTTKIYYPSLCDAFWDAHDPTNKDFLNFGISTHLRSVIYYSTEEQRKQAQESKIRRQMKLNKRIVTKVIPLDGDLFFFIAENQHQKYYLQRHSWLCESLGLRSTEQFVNSNIASKLNGILAMDGEQIIDKLTKFLDTHGHGLSRKTKSACQEIIEDLQKK